MLPSTGWLDDARGLDRDERHSHLEVGADCGRDARELAECQVEPAGFDVGDVARGRLEARCDFGLREPGRRPCTPDLLTDDARGQLRGRSAGHQWKTGSFTFAGATSTSGSGLVSSTTWADRYGVRNEAASPRTH